MKGNFYEYYSCEDFNQMTGENLILVVGRNRTIFFTNEKKEHSKRDREWWGMYFKSENEIRKEKLNRINSLWRRLIKSL